jgi:alcohol sulfotransferase
MVLGHEAERTGASIPCEQTPRNLFYLGEILEHFPEARVIHMVRDPRDVAVSQFFQWKFRMRPEKKALNAYPEHDSECSIFDFVMHEGGGMPKVIGFMNLWAQERSKLRQLSMIRYEDLRADPHTALSRVAEFLGIPADAACIQEAVDYASFENMKKKESGSGFRMSGGRMAPGDQGNPDSYKTRRAKVGGYRDYFEDDQIVAIDRMVAARLDPFFGYGDGRDTECTQA